VRNDVSNTEKDLRTKIVSGLRILSAESRVNKCKVPLMCLGIDRVSVHRDLREELVDQAEEPRIIGTEGCLQKRGGCIFSEGGL
jgi:hypothetical protein